MKRLLLILCVVVFCSGCEGFKNEMKSWGTANTKGDYEVTLFSGGKEVRKYIVIKSYINSETETDGWFFFIDGKIIRISGDVEIKRVD